MILNTANQLSFTKGEKSTFWPHMWFSSTLIPGLPQSQIWDLERKLNTTGAVCYLLLLLAFTKLSVALKLFCCIRRYEANYLFKLGYFSCLILADQ